MNKLLDYLSNFYCPADYPALAAQIQRWAQSRPFSGAKILDATPIFRNTMLKYAALLTGGAELTIAVGKNIPCDEKILETAAHFGIRIADENILRENFDAVADCAGRHTAVSSRYGYAELTRSGLEYYRDMPRPVFSVDSGMLKLFETKFGTGESFIRAMNMLGYNDFAHKKIVIFGGGKVGSGTAFYAARNGADTIIIDKKPIVPPLNAAFVSAENPSAVKAALNGVWCVVSATGLAGILAEYVTTIIQNPPLIVNMGVEDEFGPTLPDSMVLNRKRPLNFILEEPTKVNYIDPSMALSNMGLLRLLQGKVAHGINLPPPDVEMQIIDDLRRCGKLDNEINLILKEYQTI